MKILLSILLLLPINYIGPGNPVFNEDCEGPQYCVKADGYINSLYTIENCNPGPQGAGGDTARGTQYDWTLSRDFDTVYQGKASLRFEVRYNQPVVGGAKRRRSEIAVFYPQGQPEYLSRMPEMWYSFAVYFPAAGQGNDPNSDETYNQWFEDGDEDCTVRMRNGRLYFECVQATGSTVKLYDMYGAVNATAITSQSTASTTYTPVPKDTWHVFVFHFIHSQNPNGLVEIYRDGTKIQTINGRNMHSSIYSKWKVGIYKADYTTDSTSSIQPKRIVFFDNIRVGDGNATYADMVSSVTAPPDPPAPGGIKSRKKYRAINAPYHF